MYPKYANILETIGSTPLVRVNRLAPAHVNVYAKIESFNPMGSVKDRMARAVIEAAERSGALKPGQTVVEATSGNTGIGLAMVCAAKGYPLVVTMAESFSVERRRILRFLGARVVLTPAALKGTGMVDKARELADAHGWFLARQFENEANAEVHARTTARELLGAFADEQLDYFVTGYGTGGTLQGVARVLRAESPGTRVIVAEPDNAPLLRSGIPQAYAPDRTPAASHPQFRPHLMQGWTPDFVARLAGEAIEAGMIDDIVPVDGAVALETSRALARNEGIFAGISGGATMAAALQVAATAPAGSNIACMLPDTAERYLSTPLFADIDADMDADELALSRSTPGARFDQPGTAASPVRPLAAPAGDAEAQAFVDRAISDPEQPVVMFALAWCEFCWAVRKLFTALGIPWRSVDLDSVELQVDDLGTRLRPVLAQRTGSLTIPRVFIAGRHVGGCTEVFEAHADGRLEQWLQESGLDVRQADDLDPSALLPGWIHPRSSGRAA